MNELKITTNTLTPAEVSFNCEEISKQLDLVLEKYTNLVFTEETDADCKRTMADLRKGKKAVNDFRLKTKKQLTESIKPFEDDCKELCKKFDEVIDPLKEQADLFETTRREDKRIEVQGLIDNLIEVYELPYKYSKELMITDNHLLKSVTIKSIEEELDGQAIELANDRDQEELDIEFIKETVAKANKEKEVTLLAESYIRLMGSTDLSRIISSIHDDTNRLIKAREAEEERLEKERVKIEKEERERVLFESVPEYLETGEIKEENKVIERESISQLDFQNLPKEKVLISKTYTVEGTAKELLELENYISIFLNLKDVK